MVKMVKMMVRIEMYFLNLKCGLENATGYLDMSRKVLIPCLNYCLKKSEIYV